MQHRLGRYLAPLALLVCVVAVLAVVTSTVGGGSDPEPEETPATESKPTSTSRRTGSTTTSTSASGSQERGRTYTVKSGDTLAAIAEQTGVTVEEIQRLNEGVDPQALRTGQKLKLSE